MIIERLKLFATLDCPLQIDNEQLTKTMSSKLTLANVLMIQLPKVKLAFVTLLVSTGLISNLSPGLTHLSSQIIASPPQPQPSGNGTPKGRRTPGGTRGPCINTDQPLTALVPEEANGETTAEYPIFWFYVPNAAENINTIEFSLHNRDETKTLYRTSVKLTKTPGVIGIPLPAKPENSLQLNQSYLWRLVVFCNPNNSPEEALDVYGFVTRVQQNPNAWYDRVTNLAKRYLADPQNPEVKKAWVEMLKSVGLEGLAQAPLVSSVISNSVDLK